MKHLALLLTLALSTGSHRAHAETVYKVAVKSVSGNRLIVRFTAEPGPYNANEGICIYRNRKTVACGSVISSDANTVEIRILRGVTQFMPNEGLLVRGNEKFNLADSKTDVSAPGPKGAKPPIKQALNISTGVIVFAPATFFLIPLTIDYAIGTKTILGIEPFYATSGPALTVIGANLHFHYYFKERYRRLYFFLGLGYFSVTGKAVDTTTGLEVTENLGSIAVRFGLGNRWVFGKRFNMGLQGGGMYLSKTEGEQLNFGFNQISGMIGLQFGMLF